MNVGSAFLAGPDVVHFYSYVTGVSFELPVGFRADGEDDASANYVDDESPPARVQVRVVGELEEGSDPAIADTMAARLADGFSNAAGESVSRAERLVDGVPAHTVVMRMESGSLMHETVFAVDGRVLVVVAMTPAERASELLPAFDTVVDSIRLVAL
jgi:hypothetical protein